MYAAAARVSSVNGNLSVCGKTAGGYPDRIFGPRASAPCRHLPTKTTTADIYPRLSLGFTVSTRAVRDMVNINMVMD